MRVKESMLRFCNKCDNITTLQSNEEDKLETVCRQCGDRVLVEGTFDRDSLCVYSKSYGVKNIDTSSLVNEFTHMDPTLPRLRNKKCVNDTCATHQKLYTVSGVLESDFWKSFGDGAKPESLKSEKKFGEKKWVLSGLTDELLPSVTNLVEKSGGELTEYQSEVVFIKYDDENMKYLYICTICNSTWTN